jgi:hypothetical protein
VFGGQKRNHYFISTEGINTKKQIITSGNGNRLLIKAFKESVNFEGGN